MMPMIVLIHPGGALTGSIQGGDVVLPDQTDPDPARDPGDPAGRALEPAGEDLDEQGAPTAK